MLVWLKTYFLCAGDKLLDKNITVETFNTIFKLFRNFTNWIDILVSRSERKISFLEKSVVESCIKFSRSENTLKIKRHLAFCITCLLSNWMLLYFFSFLDFWWLCICFFLVRTSILFGTQVMTWEICSILPSSHLWRDMRWVSVLLLTFDIFASLSSFFWSSEEGFGCQ